MISHVLSVSCASLDLSIILRSTKCKCKCIKKKKICNSFVWNDLKYIWSAFILRFSSLRYTVNKNLFYSGCSPNVLFQENSDTTADLFHGCLFIMLDRDSVFSLLLLSKTLVYLQFFSQPCAGQLRARCGPQLNPQRDTVKCRHNEISVFRDIYELQDPESHKSVKSQEYFTAQLTNWILS